MAEHTCDLLEACPVGDLREEVSTLRAQLAEAQAALEAERTAREQAERESKLNLHRVVACGAVAGGNDANPIYQPGGKWSTQQSEQVRALRLRAEAAEARNAEAETLRKALEKIDSFRASTAARDSGYSIQYVSGTEYAYRACSEIARKALATTPPTPDLRDKQIRALRKALEEVRFHIEKVLDKGLYDGASPSVIECIDKVLSATPPTLDPRDEAIASLYNTMVFDARDWAQGKADAWLYAIVVGWGDALDDVVAKHHWSPSTLERLKRLHAAISTPQQKPPASKPRQDTRKWGICLPNGERIAGICENTGEEA